MSIKIDRDQALKGIYAMNAAVGAVAGVLDASMPDAKASLFNGLVCDIMDKVGEEKLREGFEQIVAFYKRNKAACESLEKGADGVIIT